MQGRHLFDGCIGADPLVAGDGEDLAGDVRLELDLNDPVAWKELRLEAG